MAVANVQFDSAEVRLMLKLLVDERPRDAKKPQIERELLRTQARIAERGSSRSELRPGEFEHLLKLLDAQPDGKIKLSARAKLLDGQKRAEHALQFERERSARVRRNRSELTA